MKLKQRTGDFRVRELLREGFLTESGPYRVFRVTKKKITSIEAVSMLAANLDLTPADISIAGLKDRQGLTTQFMSVLDKGLAKHFQVKEPDLRIEPVGFSKQPLESTDSVGNSFELVVRDVRGADLDILRANLPIVRETGYINYFDDQRFGNLRHNQGWIARRLMRGELQEALKDLLCSISLYEPPHQKKFKTRLFQLWGNWEECRSVASRFGQHRSLFEHLLNEPNDFEGAFKFVANRLRLIHLYAYQSHIWNRAVAAAVRSVTELENRLFVRSEEGPLLHPQNNDALFERYGTSFRLPGPGLEDVEHPEQRKLLEAALADEGLTPEQFRIDGIAGFQLKGEERALVVLPEHLRVRPAQRDMHNRGAHMIETRFQLPRGAYATLLIRRLLASSSDDERLQSRERRENGHRYGFQSRYENASPNWSGDRSGGGYQKDRRYAPGGADRPDRQGGRGGRDGQRRDWNERVQGGGSGGERRQWDDRGQGRGQRDGGYRGDRQGQGGGERRSWSDRGQSGGAAASGGGYRGNQDRGGQGGGGYRGGDRQREGGYQGGNRQGGGGGGYRGDNRQGGGQQGGYRGRDDRQQGGGYRGGDQQRGGGGYRGQGDQGGGGYRGRDNRHQGGSQGGERRPWSDRGQGGQGGGYQGRNDRQQGGGQGGERRPWNDRGQGGQGGGGYRGRDDRQQGGGQGGERPAWGGRGQGGGGGYRGAQGDNRQRGGAPSGGGGYRGQGGQDGGGYRGRDDRQQGGGQGGYRGRDDRQGARQGGGDRQPWGDRGQGGQGGYRGGNQQRGGDDRGQGGGGYRGQGSQGGGGYRGRDDRHQGGQQGGERRPWSDRGQGGNRHQGGGKPWENRGQQGGGRGDDRGERKPWAGRGSQGTGGSGGSGASGGDSPWKKSTDKPAWKGGPWKGGSGDSAPASRGDAGAEKSSDSGSSQE